MKSSNIGGQAVLEGVMMKNGETYAVAVRKPDGEIEVKTDVHKSIVKWKALTKTPLIRGVFNFIDSMVLGMKTLTYSASFYEDEEEEAKALTEEEAKKQEKKDSFIMGCTVAFSIVLAIGIFMVLPYFLIDLAKNIIKSNVVLAALEGVLRLVIFVGYIVLISGMQDIKRVYMYHGAEHKCINCIENGLELNVENVRKSSKQHKRCGTSFLLFVMLVSCVMFFFIRAESMVVKVLLRLALIPVIAGISYELIKWAGNSESPIVNILSKPGLWLQNLTTKEPDDDMIEVAIKSVEAVFDWKTYLEETYGVEKMTLEEAYSFGKGILGKAEIADAEIDAWLLLEHVTGVSRAMYFVNPKQELNANQEREYQGFVEKRAQRIPLQHLTGTQDFMGLTFEVNEHVLIPRQDTEVLVETVYPDLEEGMRILDMCTGSGCILISLLRMMQDVKGRDSVWGIGVDISEEALEVAGTNARKLGTDAIFIQSNLFENVEGMYDVIVSNPPYIRTDVIEQLEEEVRLHDPFAALDGKEDGLYFYREIVRDSKKYLKKNGKLYFEIGHDQGEDVKKLMEDAGFANVMVKKDLAGLDRVVFGVYNISEGNRN